MGKQLLKIERSVGKFRKSKSDSIIDDGTQYDIYILLLLAFEFVFVCLPPCIVFCLVCFYLYFCLPACCKCCCNRVCFGVCL